MKKDRYIEWYIFRTDYHLCYDELLFGWEEVSHGTYNMLKLAEFFIINFKLI